jgi:hypothetical protein
MELIIFFGVPLLVTIPVTVLLCHFQVRSKRRVSYGTMIAGAVIVPLSFLILGSGGECFSQAYWSRDYGPNHKLGPDWPFSELKDMGFAATICAMPALGVVAYYQRRGKRNEAQVA